MPKFEQVVTIVALLTGPTGIWFGWWLAERSTEKRETHVEKAAREQAERTRALDLTRLARKLASEARSLAHAVYLKSAQRKVVHNLDGLFEDFNRVRGDYREAVLTTRVLGPSWIVEQAEAIEFKGQQMTQLILNMQQQFSRADVTRANAEIPEFDGLVDALVATLSDRYNDSASELPDRPDLEAAK